jgi:hypothetical protein
VMHMDRRVAGSDDRNDDDPVVVDAVHRIADTKRSNRTIAHWGGDRCIRRGALRAVLAAPLPNAALTYDRKSAVQAARCSGRVAGGTGLGDHRRTPARRRACPLWRVDGLAAIRVHRPAQAIAALAPSPVCVPALDRQTAAPGSCGGRGRRARRRQQWVAASGKTQRPNSILLTDRGRATERARVIAPRAVSGDARARPWRRACAAGGGRSARTGARRHAARKEPLPGGPVSVAAAIEVALESVVAASRTLRRRSVAMGASVRNRRAAVGATSPVVARDEPRVCGSASGRSRSGRARASRLAAAPSKSSETPAHGTVVGRAAACEDGTCDEDRRSKPEQCAEGCEAPPHELGYASRGTPPQPRFDRFVRG